MRILEKHNKALGKAKLFQALINEREYEAVLEDIKKRGITRRIYVIEGLTKETRINANI